MMPRTAQPQLAGFTVSQRRLVSVALVGLFVWVTGCQSYKQIELGQIADHGKIRVTTTDGERATIRDPRVEADSIAGSDSEPIPLDQVSKVQVMQTGALSSGDDWQAISVGILRVTLE